MLRVYIYLLLSIVLFVMTNTTIASGSEDDPGIRKLECRSGLSLITAYSDQPKIFKKNVLGCEGNLLGFEFNLTQDSKPDEFLYADIWRPSEDGTQFKLISSERLQGAVGDKFQRVSNDTKPFLKSSDVISVRGVGVEDYLEIVEEGIDDIEVASLNFYPDVVSVGSVRTPSLETISDAMRANIRHVIAETEAIAFHPSPPEHHNGNLIFTKYNMNTSILYNINRPLPFINLNVTIEGTNLACERSRASINESQGSVMVVAGQQPINRTLARGPFGAVPLLHCDTDMIYQINNDQTRCSYICRCPESTGCDVVHMLMIPDFFADTPTIIDSTKTRIQYIN